MPLPEIRREIGPLRGLQDMISPPAERTCGSVPGAGAGPKIIFGKAVDNQGKYDRISPGNAMTEPSDRHRPKARGDSESPRHRWDGRPLLSGPGRPGRPIPVTG